MIMMITGNILFEDVRNRTDVTFAAHKKNLIIRVFRFPFVKGINLTILIRENIRLKNLANMKIDII